MKIFVSWSGELSHAIAIALSAWLPQVINAAKPWLSSEDVEKGTRWFSEITGSLAQTEFGILCLTADNLNAPWILFEAGALSKSLDQSRVSPLLIDITNADLRGPLSQFNTTSLTEGDILKLVKTINGRLPEDRKRLEGDVNLAFEVWWPRLKAEIEAARKIAKQSQSTPSVVSHRKSEDLLQEILELSRITAQLVQQLRAASQVSRSVVQSVASLAAGLGVSPEALLEHFRILGMPKESPSDPVFPSERISLLDHLGRIIGVTPKTGIIDRTMGDIPDREMPSKVEGATRG